MEHFTSFYADFGIVKQANKQLKRLDDYKVGKSYSYNLNKKSQEIASDLKADKLLSTTYGKKNLKKSKDKFNNYVKEGRAIKNQNDSIDPLSQPLLEKSFDISSGKTRLDRENFTDIRATNDKAASSTGYLGYQKDPYKGLGGMMEEPVPVLIPRESTRNPRYKKMKLHSEFDDIF